MGGFAELRAKYGASTGRVVVNKAIREEIPGGGKILDLLIEIRERRSKRRYDDDFFERVFQTLTDANQEMADATLGKDWKK